MQDKENKEKDQKINDNYINQILYQMSESDIKQFMKQYKENKKHVKSTEKKYPKRGRPKKIVNQINNLKQNQNSQKEKENKSSSDIVDLTNDTDASEKKHEKLNSTVDMSTNIIKRKKGRPRKNKSEESKNKYSKKIFLNHKRKRDLKKDNTPLKNNSDNKIYVTPELKNLLSLEKEYGLSKIISCLYKPEIEKSDNVLEKSVSEIINKINLQETLALLLQIQTMTSSDKNEILNDSKNLSENKKNETTISLIEEENEVEVESKNCPENSKKKCEKVLKSKTEVKVTKKTDEIKIVENLENFENMDPSLHFHKEKGEIFKFAKNHLIKDKKTWVFHCCDKSCGGQGTYEISTKKFKNTQEHTKSNKDHDYFKKLETNKNVMNFRNSDFNEAQVFKKNDGTRIIHYYN